MKKSILVLLSVLLCLSMFSCEGDVGTSTTSSEITTPSNDEVRELFKKASDELFWLETENPLDVLQEILPTFVAPASENIKFDDGIFFATNGKFEDLKAYYSQFFTDEALDWVLSLKFKNIDGVVYCCAVGGMTGVSASNIVITEISENYYRADFEVKMRNLNYTCTFKIKETSLGYRISETDFPFIKVNF